MNSSRIFSRNDPQVLLAMVVSLALVFSASCSKPTRARRLLSASKQAYDQARTSLLANDLKGCLAQAERSKSIAEKASRILPSGPGSEAIAEQVNASSDLALMAEDPKAGVSLWCNAMIRGDLDLASFLLDGTRVMNLSFARRLEKMSDSEKKTLVEVVNGSIRKTLETYKDLLATWQLQDLKSEISGQEAKVTASIKGRDRDRQITFSLDRDGGFWRPYDFSINQTVSLIQSLKELEVMLGEDVNLAQFMDGKGIFEAFSEVQEAAKMDPIFLSKPLINHYVKTRSEVKLRRKGKEVVIDARQMLKVIDQNGGPNRSETVMVRTTEADPAESAVGEIPVDLVDVVGTDETEMWGTKGDQ